MENIAYETMKRFYLIAYEKRVRLPKNAGSMRKIAQKLYERAAVSALPDLIVEEFDTEK
jgi:hypothetical protein